MGALPDTDDMRAAAEWLDYYDAQDGDDTGEQCKRIAEWLRDQADAKDLRDASRSHGVSVARMRELLAKSACEGAK